MLTEKDYCDYDTCVALKELGFSEPTLAYYDGFLPSETVMYLVIDEDCMPEDGVNVFDLLSNSNKYKDSKNVNAPTLWEAQKFLREEKKLIVLVGFDFCPITSEIVYNWVIVVNGNTAKISSYTYDDFEEALSEGIKAAVKILKEDETIHR